MSSSIGLRLGSKQPAMNPCMLQRGAIEEDQGAQTLPCRGARKPRLGPKLQLQRLTRGERHKSNILAHWVINGIIHRICLLALTKSTAIMITMGMHAPTAHTWYSTV